MLTYDDIKKAAKLIEERDNLTRLLASLFDAAGTGRDPVLETPAGSLKLTAAEATFIITERRKKVWEKLKGYMTEG